MTLISCLTLLTTCLLMLPAWASGPTTIKINGMHCGGCKSIVNKAVCESASLKPRLKKCDISVDQKIQVGTMIIEPVEGEKLDIEALKKTIEAAGDDYIVANIDSASAATATVVVPATKTNKKK